MEYVRKGEKANLIAHLKDHPSLNINFRNCRGETALYIAATTEESSSIVEVLLRNSKDSLKLWI